MIAYEINNTPSSQRLLSSRFKFKDLRFLSFIKTEETNEATIFFMNLFRRFEKEM